MTMGLLSTLLSTTIHTVRIRQKVIMMCYILIGQLFRDVYHTYYAVK